MPLFTRKALVNAAIVAGILAGLLVIYRVLPSRRPANLGVVDGRLAPCPDSPNCVSSRSDDPAHRIDPIPFEGSVDEAMRRIRAVLATMPRTRIVRETPDYLHAEAASRVFGFLDDLEFRVDPEARRIDVRSASRVGHSDLGVNRDRVERFRRAFERIGTGS